MTELVSLVSDSVALAPLTLVCTFVSLTENNVRFRCGVQSIFPFIMLILGVGMGILFQQKVQNKLKNLSSQFK